MLEWKELVDDDDTQKMSEDDKDQVLGRKNSPYRSMADQVAGIKSEENLQDTEDMLEKLGPLGKVVGTFSPYLVLGVRECAVRERTARVRGVCGTRAPTLPACARHADIAPGAVARTRCL